MKPRSAVRSMSYAPESVRPGSGRERPEWILCRNLDEFPVPDDAELLRWTEQGRVRPDDFLVNPRLDTCVQARDIPELDAIFRKGNARLLANMRKLICSTLAVFLMQCATVARKPMERIRINSKPAGASVQLTDCRNPSLESENREDSLR